MACDFLAVPGEVVFKFLIQLIMQRTLLDDFPMDRYNLNQVGLNSHQQCILFHFPSAYNFILLLNVTNTILKQQLIILTYTSLNIFSYSSTSLGSSFCDLPVRNLCSFFCWISYHFLVHLHIFQILICISFSFFPNVFSSSAVRLVTLTFVCVHQRSFVIECFVYLILMFSNLKICF